MKKLNEKYIELIKQKIQLDNKLYIIRLAMVGDTMDYQDFCQFDRNHNIYCINENYEIIWQIQAETNPIQQSADHNYSDPFTYMELENGKLHGETFSGFEYIINVKTGKAEMTGWSK